MRTSVFYKMWGFGCKKKNKVTSTIAFIAETAWSSDLGAAWEIRWFQEATSKCRVTRGNSWVQHTLLLSLTILGINPWIKGCTVTMNQWLLILLGAWRKKVFKRRFCLLTSQEGLHFFCKRSSSWWIMRTEWIVMMKNVPLSLIHKQTPASNR